jgi:hypothetical protein
LPLETIDDPQFRLDRAHGEARMKSTLVDLMLAKHHQTEKDVLVSETGEETRAVWLPLSRVEIEDARNTAKGKLKGGQTVTLQMIVVTMPERLAMEKGLV